MASNTLFKPYKRNHCKPFKPLGTWTTEQGTQSEEDEDDDDSE